jgi:hypothetical protein
VLIGGAPVLTEFVQRFALRDRVGVREACHDRLIECVFAVLEAIDVEVACEYYG